MSDTTIGNYIISPNGSITDGNGDTVTSMSLRGSYVGPEGVVAIAEALKLNTTLTSISLSGNNIGPEGVVAIAEALKVNKNLTSINLGYNDIGPEGAKEIAKALKENTTLTSISLFWNNIGSEGAKEIAEALKVNKALTSIDLYSNNIGPAGSIALTKALKGNIFLRDVNRGLLIDSSIPRNIKILALIKDGLDSVDSRLSEVITEMPDGSFGKDYLTALVSLCEVVDNLDECRHALNKLLRHNLEGLADAYKVCLMQKMEPLLLYMTEDDSDAVNFEAIFGSDEVDLSHVTGQQESSTEMLAYATSLRDKQGHHPGDVMGHLVNVISMSSACDEESVNDMLTMDLDEWVAHINTMDVESDIYKTIERVLTDIASLQLQKGFHPNNILAAFSGIGMALNIKENVQKSATKIQGPPKLHGAFPTLFCQTARGAQVGRESDTESIDDNEAISGDSIKGFALGFASGVLVGGLTSMGLFFGNVGIAGLALSGVTAVTMTALTGGILAAVLVGGVVFYGVGRYYDAKLKSNISVNTRYCLRGEQPTETPHHPTETPHHPTETPFNGDTRHPSLVIQKWQHKYFRRNHMR